MLPSVQLANAIQKVTNLCIRRGFIFPSAEIYGSFGGFFDYGPAGVELKRNIVAAWWKHFVHQRDDMLGLDGAVLTHPRIWKASGHLDEFNDPLVECKKCKSRFRADHLIEQELKISVDGMGEDKINDLLKKHKLCCLKCKGELSETRNFNLMFQTHVGASVDAASEAYLRPETAQVIFTQFKTLQQIGRKALPFGIAQVGKAFRNEISPRNFVFRGREFEQMEIEFFIHPEKLDECPDFASLAKHKARFFTAEQQEHTGAKDHGKSGPSDANGVVMTFGQAVEKKIIQTKWQAYWLAQSWMFFESLGLKTAHLRLRQHTPTELSHYSAETWDVEYQYPEWGWKELQGVANRTDFDLLAHQKESGKDQSVYDEPTKQKVVPYVIEPSFGLDRLAFTLLLDAFEEKKESKSDVSPDEKGKTLDEAKTILHLSPVISPVKAAVFPLMKKDGLAEKAKEVYAELKKTVAQSTYDEAGSIGKRYARQDEIGTPYCVTVDHQTLQDDTVTLRERDSGGQKRVKIEKLSSQLTF